MTRVGKAPEGAATSGPVDPVAGKTVAEILGEIVWLMTQDPAGHDMKVAEIEALVMPAILARRFHIKYAQVPDMRRLGATTLQPIAVEIYGSSETGTPAAIARFSVRLAGRTQGTGNGDEPE